MVSSVSTVTRLWAGRPGIDSRQGLAVFLFITMSIPAPGPTQLPIQWVPEVIFSGVKRPRRETLHPPLSTSEVNNKSSWRST
jgi:hypothetical protein